MANRTQFQDEFEDDEHVLPGKHEMDEAASAFVSYLDSHRCDDDGVVTTTSKQQKACEESCASLLLTGHVTAGGDTLHRSLHIEYLRKGLGPLSASWSSLDASRTWLAYWCLQGLDVLDAPLDSALGAFHLGVIDFVRRCACAGGGYSGGPGHAPHAAATFAAISALLVIGTPDAYSAIDRPGLLAFYRRMKQPPSSVVTTASDAPLPSPSQARLAQGPGPGVRALHTPRAQTVTRATSWPGSFTVQDSGESDVRGTYCSVAVAFMCGILTADLADGVSAFLLRTQTVEGGLGGEPGNEAHGGYTYCALAALRILELAGREALAADVEAQQQQGAAPARGQGQSQGRTLSAYERRVWTECVQAPSRLQYNSLCSWLSQRQLALEGGFAGRTNKLVDACYSFWQAACFHMVPGSTITKPSYWHGRHADGSAAGSDSSAVASAAVGSLFDRRALQVYLLRCGQDTTGGGIRDKPGKSRDYYHTCYGLQGMSVAQHDYTGAASSVPTVVQPDSASVRGRQADPASSASGSASATGAGARERTANVFGTAIQGIPDEGQADEEASSRGRADNTLLPVHPLFGLCWDRYEAARAHFRSQPLRAPLEATGQE